MENFQLTLVGMPLDKYQYSIEKDPKDPKRFIFIIKLKESVKN